MKKKTLNTYEAVKEKALRLLEFRSHSEQELIRKLRMNGASDEHIDMALSFCREYGFVNDSAYAAHKAADLFNLKKFGRRRIYSELKSLGIADDDISSAIDALSPDAELTNLRAVAEKKLGGDMSGKNLDRCIRYLIYRGYDIYDIKDILGEMEVTDDI